MFKKGAFIGLLLLCIAWCFGTGFTAFSSVEISTFTAEADVDFADTGSFDVGLKLIDGAGIGLSTTVMTWSNIASTTAWKASNAVIEITNTYRTAGWHVRIYTDNIADGADPEWNKVQKSTSDYNCAGLLAVTGSSTTQSIPMCWRVTDNTTNTYDIRSASGVLYDFVLGALFPAFHYMKDFSTPDDPDPTYDEKFYNTYAEAAAQGQKAIDSYDSVMVADQSRGLHGATGPTWYERDDSLFYIYLGANFNNATTGRTYKTNQLKVELIVDP